MAKTKVAENSINLEKFKEIFNEYKVAKDKIEKDFKLDLNNNFNFFEAISDTYKKENLHSDLMKQILDPTTKEIGNINYLKSFFNIIGVQLKDFDDLRNVKVERERNRIDILISDDDNAIIIENKINNAPDQDKQLERYYKIVSKHKEVKKIVYITLSSEDNGEPSNLKGYGDSETIEKLLIHLPAVSKDRQKKSLINWLDECIKITPENNIGKIFLGQYKQLLAYLGGKVLMLENKENCIKEIFNSGLVNDLIDMLKHRYDFICELIAKDLKINGESVEGSCCIFSKPEQINNKDVKKYFTSINKEKIEIGYYNPSKEFNNTDLKKIENTEYVFNKDGKWIYAQITRDDKNFDQIKKEIKTFMN